MNRLVSAVYIFNRLWLVSTLLSLGGCTFLPQHTSHLDTAQQAALWLQNQQRLSGINHWQLTGRLGLKIPGQSGTLSLDWQQDRDTFQLFLDGPFGQSVAAIKGDRNRVVAEITGQGTLTGTNLEQLMAGATGWQLPVRDLRFWVLGLPAPNSPHSSKVLDAQGNLRTMVQQGWQVTYLTYHNQHGVRLPTHIRISRNDVRLTLLVTRWQDVNCLATP